MLYAFGSNSNGQLGIGTYDDVSEPHQCIITYKENDHPGTPIKIRAGGNHTLLLFDSGRLFAAGSSINNQTASKSRTEGAKGLPNPQTTFTEIEMPAGVAKVKSCSATWEASFIVTSDHEVYTIGTGPTGELGTGIENSYQLAKLPRLPPEHETIVDIASGLRHTVIVLSNGDIYGWGSGRKGQLGEPLGIVRTPRQIKGAHLIERATCGTEFTYLVGDPHEGRHIVLGSDKWGVKTTSPSTCMHDWKDITSCWGSIFILEKDGKLLSWGRDDQGQLGSSDVTVDDVEQIAAGSEHFLALKRSGELLAWGWGEHGNCGSLPEETIEDGSADRRLNIIQTSDPVVGVAAGCATSFFWTASRPDG